MLAQLALMCCELSSAIMSSTVSVLDTYPPPKSGASGANGAN